MPIRFGQRDIGFPVSPVSRFQPFQRTPVQVNTLQPDVVPAQGYVAPGTEGYNGPGTYLVAVLGGLRTVIADARAPGGTSPAANTPQGTLVQVQADAGRYLNSGWLPIVSPLLGGLGLIQAPGGAGLVRQGESSAYVGPVNRGRLLANRINRPIGPSIRGYGKPIG